MMFQLHEYDDANSTTSRNMYSVNPGPQKTQASGLLGNSFYLRLC